MPFIYQKCAEYTLDSVLSAEQSANTLSPALRSLHIDSIALKRIDNYNNKPFYMSPEHRHHKTGHVNYN